MIETYVKIVKKNRPKDIPVTYCPIDIEKHEITLGLSLIGFYPKGAKVVGTFNEDTEKLILYKNKEENKGV